MFVIDFQKAVAKIHNAPVARHLKDKRDNSIKQKDYKFTI